MGGAGDHPSDHPLHSLTLDGMAEAFADLRGREDRGDFSHAEWLGRLIDREATSHSTKTFPTPMRAARLCRVRACSEEVDCRAPASATGRRFRTSPPSGRSMSAATC
ncbi:MAG: ATP-binding protein [Pseudomonadota bacterium]